MLICLQQSFRQHKHVRKLSTTCGRLITNYMYFNGENTMVTCITKPNTRPLWYVKDVRIVQGKHRSVVLNSYRTTVRATSVTKERVTCVDCLDSGHFALLDLQQTELE